MMDYRKRHGNKTSFLMLMAVILLSTYACKSKEQRISQKMEEAMYMNYEGDYEGAIRVLGEVIRLDPKNEYAWFRRGNAWFNLRETQKAIEDLTKAIELNPNFADAWFNRGNIWFFLDEQDKACADWIESERLGKPNVGDKTRFCP